MPDGYIHQNILARKLSFVLPHIRTNYGKFNIRFSDTKIWNNIEEVKDVNVLPFKTFKTQMKDSFINSYSTI